MLDRKGDRPMGARVRRIPKIGCTAMMLLGGNAALLAANVCNVSSYGAKGDGVTKDTFAVQRAIDDCSAKGGGTVRLDHGTFVTGPITLKSHISLEVGPGSLLLGSLDKADYAALTLMREPAVQPLILASNVEDVSIRGRGIIDGRGQPWWDEGYAHKNSPDYVAAKRPRLVFLDHVKHVAIEGITIQNSASWQVTLYDCEDVTVRD